MVYILANATNIFSTMPVDAAIFHTTSLAPYYLAISHHYGYITYEICIYRIAIIYIQATKLYIQNKATERQNTPLPTTGQHDGLFASVVAVSNGSATEVSREQGTWCRDVHGF